MGIRGGTCLCPGPPRCRGAGSQTAGLWLSLVQGGNGPGSHGRVKDMTGLGRGRRLSEMACQGPTPCPSQCRAPRPPGVAAAPSWAPPHRCSRTPLLLKGLGLTVGCRALPTLPWPGRPLQPQPESWGSWPFPGHNWLPHTQIHALPSVWCAPSPVPRSSSPAHSHLSVLHDQHRCRHLQEASLPPHSQFSLKLQLPKQLKRLMCLGQGLARAPW